MIGLAEAEIEIGAPIDRVFELWTSTEGLTSWMADHAEVDLRPGGAWRWVHEGGEACSGAYVEIAPPRRLVFTYGWETGRFGVPAGSTTVAVDFTEHDGGTRVRVRHDGLTPEAAERHRIGWSHFLGVLAAIAGGSGPHDEQEMH